MASSRFAALLPPSAKRFIFWELMEMMAISLMAKKALTKIRIKMSTILGHMSIWKKSTSFCNGPGALPVRGARLYVALFPCNECAKAIIQSGIREIIYFSDKYAETANIRASKRMLDAAGVRYHPLQTELASITLDFRAPESAGIPQKSDADEK